MRLTRVLRCVSLLRETLRKGTYFFRSVKIGAAFHHSPGAFSLLLSNLKLILTYFLLVRYVVVSFDIFLRGLGKHICGRELLVSALAGALNTTPASQSRWLRKYIALARSLRQSFAVVASILHHFDQNSHSKREARLNFIESR